MSHCTRQPARRTFVHVLLSLLIACTVLLTPHAALAAGTPVATLDVPPQTMIGEQLRFGVTFDNAGTTTGYGPYIDLVLPAAGADGAGAATDDGITFAGAAYLGQTLTPIAPSPFLCTTGTFTHPLTGLTTACTIGSQVIVLQLPFGSFTAAQPPATIEVTANLSNLADLGTPLAISARAGFIYGNDPLNNPATDPPITSATTSASTTPTLIRLKKTYLGPEDETATGPNFPRQYLIEVDLASGQTVTSLDLTDTLPNNLQFVSLDATTIRGTATATTAISTPGTTVPGGTLTRRFSSVTGTTATNDATMLFTFYVPRDDAASAVIINPSNGDDVPSLNEASALGSWTPVDARDLGGTANAVANLPGPEHTLLDKSIAIQKYLTNRTDAAYSPGDVLEYRLEFQVSDFFAFQNVVINDTFSDGQRFDPSFPPTLLLNGNSFVLAAAPINPANFSVDTSQIGNDTNPATNGSSTIAFRISDELIARGQPTGRLLGGCVPTTGTGGPAPDCAVSNDGATTARVVFRTILQETFSDTYPSGDPSVDQGDVFTNNVQIDGAVLNTANLTPTGQTEAENSSAEGSIAIGALSKSVYAIDGVACAAQPCANVRTGPGHTVTYRIRYTLPTSDFEGLSLIDYLPLPIFNATEVTTFNNVASAAVPAAGVVKLGPADTYHLRPGAVTPTIATTGPGADNRITLTYGSYDAASNVASEIDLLFTVTALGTPFADGLFLTNQVRASESATNAGTSEADAIVQVQLTEPLLNTRKGVIATNGATGIFAPTSVGPVAFSAPASGCPRFSGTISSPNLATTPINSNLSAAQSGQRISFAIVVENTGSGLNGAYDVRIRDTIPAGFQIPAGAPGLNLCVTNGAGAALPFTNLGTGFFDPVGGIELVDPSASAGALAAGRDASNALVTTGQNIAIITYDLQLAATAAPGQSLVNTGTVYNYASVEGGTDFTSTDLTDTATVQVATTSQTKSIVATSEGSTSEAGTPRPITIGEIVRYRLAVQVPESTSTNLQVIDRLPTGLRFLNNSAVRVALIRNGGGLTSSTITPALAGCGGLNVTGNTSAVTPTCPLPDTAISNSPTTNTDTYTSGTDVYFKLGNLTNADGDADAEFVVIEFNAILDNSAAGSNDAGETRNNDFVATVNGVQSGAASPAVGLLIVEPSITNVDKVALTPTGDAGDVVTFRVTYSNATGAAASTAFETRLIDTIPVGMTLDLSSIAVTLGGGATGITNSSNGNLIELTIATIPPGGTVQVEYSATIQGSATPGQVLTNTAGVFYTSLPGPGGTIVNPTGSNTPDPSGGTYGERSGSGTPASNDYFDSDPATVTIVSPTPVKSIVTTSAAHTGNVGGTERVAVGEIVRYRLAVQLPEGSSANFQLRDELPAGLQFLNDGTARAALIANEVGIASSTLTGPGLSISGNETSAGGITPSFALPDEAISNSATTNADAYASGTDVFFKLGDLTNSDSDADQEVVLVEFNALVLNFAANQSGALLSNTFTVFIGGVSRAVSPAVNVGVAEPLVNVVKSIAAPAAGTPIDAGDLLSYNLVVSNLATGDSAAAAFDLRLNDLLDNRLSLQSVSITKPAYAVITDNTAGNAVELLIDRLNPGDSVTATVTVRVAAGVLPGDVIPNTANVSYTSLPGGGTTANPTGSVTPGASGAATGERNGDDGSGGPLNDYAASSTVNLTLAAPAIDKLAPTPTQYTIGETVSYDILVTLPEGIIDGLVLIDDLPSGLAYLSHSLITSAAASDGRLAADYAGNIASLTASRTSPPAVPGGDGQDLVLSFPLVTTTDDNVPGNNSFVLRVVARVLNVVANSEGSTLSNSASLRYIDPINEVPITLTDEPVDITVVEPQLTIAKSAQSSSATVGALITFRMVVAHPAGDAQIAHDVEISDTLPAGLTYEPGTARVVAGSPSGSADDSAAPTLRWRFPAIAPGQTATVEFEARINTTANPALPIINTADVTWTSLPGASPDERTGADGPGSALNDYAARSSAQVQASAYTLSKTLLTPAGGLAAVNGPIRFSIVVTNTGGTQLMPVPVSDIYNTTYLRYVGATPASDDTLDDGTIDWSNIGPIPPGESRTILVDFTAKAVTAQTTNTAQANNVFDENENELPNTTASANVAIGQPDLQLSKSDGGVTTTPGGTVAYTLSYSNVGNIGATGVVLSETVPAHSRFNAAGSTAGWSCADGAAAGTSCTLTLGSLAAGGSGSATFAVTVVTPLPAGVTQLVNSATVTDDGTNGSDPTPANNAASDTTPITATAQISATKAVYLIDEDGAANPGDRLEYEITIANTGNQDAAGIAFSDTPDANTALIVGSVTTTLGTVTSGNTAGDTQVVVTLGTLPGGATATIFFEVTIANPLPAGVTEVANQGVVTTSDGPLPTDDPATEPRPDSTVIEVVAAPDVTLSKSDGGVTTTPGGTVAYTLSYSNVGNIGATGVVLSETVPAHSRFNAAGSTAGWSCADGAAAGTSCTLPVGAVAAGGSGSATFAVTVVTPLPAGVTQLVNSATVTDDGTNGSDPTPADNSASDTTPISAAATLGATKSVELRDFDEDGAANPGDTLQYTITIANSGNQDAAGIAFSDTPDANTALIVGSVTTTLGTVTSGNTAGDTQVAVTLGTLPGGASATIVFEVTIANPLPAGVTEVANQGVVTTSDGTISTDDPATEPRPDPTVIEVVAAPDVTLSKSDGGVTTTPGGTVAYTLSYSNVGNIGATGVVLSETVPAHSRFNAAGSTAGWSCADGAAAGTSCTLPVGALAGGATGSATFAVTVVTPLSAGVTQLVNSATVTDDGTNGSDPTPANNAASDTTPISAAATLGATKSVELRDFDEDGAANPGDTLQYTITIANSGNQDAAGIAFTDTPGANTALVVGSVTTTLGTVTSGNTAGDTQVAVTLGTLPGGATATIFFEVTIANPLPAGVTEVANQGVVTTSDGTISTDDPATEPRPDPTVIEVVAAPDVTLSKSDGGVTTTPGGTVAYTLSYSNVGNIGATGVVLRETVPAHSRFNAAGSTAGWSCADGAAAGTSCTLAVGALAAGGSGSATFAVTVVTPLPAGVTQLVNSATVADDGANGSDPTPDNNAASDTTPISAAPDLWVLKSDNAATVVPGNLLSYTLSYGNRGGIGATGVVLRETVPAHSRFNAAGSTAGWSCADGAAAGTSCTLTLGALAGGATGSATFAVTIDNPLSPGVTGITNSTSIDDDDTNGADLTPADNTSQVTTPFNPTAVTLTSFTAIHQGNGIMVRWQTSSEVNTYGFDLYRSSDTNRANAVRVTPQTILGQGRTIGGAVYTWLDTEIVPGTIYTYWLQETETDSEVVEYAPVTAQYRIFFPFIRRNQE